MRAILRPFARLTERAFQRLADIVVERARDEILHPHTALLAEAQADTVAYIRQHMMDAVVFRRREDMLALALERAPAQGAILEFGVAGGESVRFLAARTDRPIHGFDSFEGLPEDWGGRHEAKGHYSTGGVLPEVPANVTLHKGWFDASIPAYAAAHDQPIALLHVDCDLYSSTKCVFDLLGGRIAAGTVIVFDEYFNMVNWRRNEFRAFQEFCAAKGITYRYLSYAYQQASVIIEDIRCP